jgi:hypothetical protein
MSNNIKIHKRQWDQPYSLVRAHVGSNDPFIGGNANFSFGANAWSPPITYNEQATYFTAITGGVDSAIHFDVNSPIELPEPNAIVIETILPTEVFTTPYTGLDSIICEAVPGSTWEWSVYAKSHEVAGFDTTIDMHIFGLDEAGQMTSVPSGKAYGHYDGTVLTIPSDKTNYFSRQFLPDNDTQVLLTGTATLADDLGPIRYLSMRIDINSECHYVSLHSMKLKPLNNKRSTNPLIWNSPKIFKPRENLSWSIASTDDTLAGGNGAPHEYLRVSFASPDQDIANPIEAGIAQYLQVLDLRGWRYGPVYDGAALSAEHGTGGTAYTFPSTFYEFPAGYQYWLLNNGSTPSANTGPINAPPPLPIYPTQPDQQHFGFKRSNEPYGEAIDHNYLYCEGSDGQAGKRFALRLPKINFNQTSREEVLSFYFHAMGTGTGVLRFFHATEGGAFYLPGDGIPHTTVTNALGAGIADELTSVRYFDPNGAHINDYITSTNITGNKHSLHTNNWYRAEVDLSALRNLDTHVIILYDQAIGTESDFAITNILVSGNNYTYINPGV